MAGNGQDLRLWYQGLRIHGFSSIRNSERRIGKVMEVEKQTILTIVIRAKELAALDKAERQAKPPGGLRFESHLDTYQLNLQGKAVWEYQDITASARPSSALEYTILSWTHSSSSSALIGSS
jgi:hypothetical protein